MNQHQLKKEIENLSHQITYIKGHLKTLPKEDIQVISSGKYNKWFLKKNGVVTYLSKKEKPYACSLAQAKYFRAMLEDLSIQLQLLKQVQAKLKKANHTDTLLNKPLYKALINSSVPNSKSQDSNEWQHQPYKSNPAFPEKLIHKTLSGIVVRSKSEEKIANILYNLHIPFRYEAEVILFNQTYYPDFTIRHPETNQIFYWEHFGKMDDKAYRNNALSKISLYCDNDIIPGINLITTYETLSHPLSTLEVEDIIKHFFL